MKNNISSPKNLLARLFSLHLSGRKGYQQKLFYNLLVLLALISTVAVSITWANHTSQAGGNLSLLTNLLTTENVRNTVAVAGGESTGSATETRTDPMAPREEDITIIGVGDVMLGHRVAPFISKYGISYPFATVREILQGADITFCNLEAPFGTKGQPVRDKEYTFRVDPVAVGSLTYGGIDVVSLANNHSLDYGPEALMETLSLLDKAQIAYAGAGPDLSAARRPALFSARGIKVAFLAYSNTYPIEFYATRSRPGTAAGEDGFIAQDVKEASRISDLVVVSFHWSSEYRTTPKDYQIAKARIAIDNGADLVIGHHPHVLQGFEVYRGKLIAYSLGNFVFGAYNPNYKDSLILKVIADRGGPKRAVLIPISVDNFKHHFQPRILTGDEAGRVLRDVKKLSEGLGTRVSIEGDTGVIYFEKA